MLEGVSIIPMQFQVLSFSDVISCLIAYAITTQLPEHAFITEKSKREELLSRIIDKIKTIVLSLKEHFSQIDEETVPLAEGEDLSLKQQCDGGLHSETKATATMNVKEEPTPFFTAGRIAFYLFFALVIFILCGMFTLAVGSAKPVIYLYPEKTTTVSVLLDFEGTLTHTYPTYRDGWTVTASPDGTLISHADNKEYSYLFWEGDSKRRFDMTKGFVVKGSDTAAFLQEKLALIGLRPKEYNEFIVYWLPHMENNRYNLIAFQEKDYTDSAKLTITPTPDSVLRVFMTYKALTFPVTIPPQELKPFVRRGFTVVEWGGAKVSR